MGMDIVKYRYIAEVAKTRNFTKAADELHISQPALTKAIRKTEGEMGITIFDRSASPLRLTYAGEVLMNEIVKILNVQETLENEMKKISTGRKGRVVVGAPFESAPIWLPKIIPGFVAAYPDIEVGIVEGNSDSLESGLLGGTIDFAVYTLPVHSTDLEYEIIGEHPIFLVSSASHRFASGVDLDDNSPSCPQYIEPRRLNGEKFLTLTPERGMYRVAMQLFERHGIKVEIVMRLSSNYAASTLAASGLGLCFTTYASCLRMVGTPGLHPVFYTIENPMFTRKLIVAYRKGNCLSRSARDMLVFAKEGMTRVPERKIIIKHGT
jgi:DNA-binding transcriptional LysR family regulator